MHLLIVVISTTMFALELTAAAATSSSIALSVNVCNTNQTIVTQILTTNEGSSCTCQASSTEDPKIPEDYVYTPGIGSHKIHTEAKNWNDARKICNDESAHLAIINSKAEAAVLVEMLNKSVNQIKNGLNTEEALLGIHDLYKEGEWVTVQGESLYSTGYSSWSPTYWGGQPDNYGNDQDCGAILSIGDMDDVNCSDKFAFFCEIPLTCE